MRIVLAAAFVALALSSVACASTRPEPVVVTAASVAEPETVPLLAKDVDDAQATPRLAASKTIGGDGESYDLGRPRKGASTIATPSRTTSTAPAPRYYYRSGRTVSRSPSGAATGTSASTTVSSAPAVAGNWPSTPSYGPSTMGK